MKDLKLLTLNCQKGRNPALKNFFDSIFPEKRYDFVLLQEATLNVLRELKKSSGEYKIIAPFVEHEEGAGFVLIIYRDDMDLVRQNFYSFENFHPHTRSRQFGLLLAEFLVEGGKLFVGSIHTHSGIYAGVRRKEFWYAKQVLKPFIQRGEIFVGGDFNTGFPFELSMARYIFSPEFVFLNKNFKGTLNSLYTEYGGSISNKAAVYFAKYGIGFSVRLDHFICDRKTFRERKFRAKVLPERVSDHSPLELMAR